MNRALLRTTITETLHARAWAILSGSVALAVSSACYGVDAGDPFDFYVADQYAYDDNLFRVPDGALESDPTLVAPKSLDDYVNRASAGINVRSDAGRQVFKLGLRFDDVRYSRNDDLNYRGGNGLLGWDWQLGSHWLGRITGRYDRAQANFSNYQFLDRDIVETGNYGLEVRYRIGSRWAVLAGGNLMDTQHSAALRRDQNFDSETVKGGVEYRTLSDNLFALEYRATTAEFPDAAALPNGDERGFDESVPGVRVRYAFTVKTSIEAQAGYLDRDYTDPAAGDYSGEIWSVVAHWEPRTAFAFDIKLWRDLRAYEDAESDYFVVDGFAVSPSWEFTQKLKLTATLSWEEQDYIGDIALLSPTDARRQDDFQSVLMSLEYTPRDMVSLGLSYRWAERESNRELRDYDTTLVSAQLKLIF